VLDKMNMNRNELHRDTQQHLDEANVHDNVSEILQKYLDRRNKLVKQIEEVSNRAHLSGSCISREEYALAAHVQVVIQLEELIHSATARGEEAGPGYTQAQWFVARVGPLIWLDDLKKDKEKALRDLLDSRT
jgi:hypothetical protein